MLQSAVEKRILTIKTMVSPGKQVIDLGMWTGWMFSIVTGYINHIGYFYEWDPACSIVEANMSAIQFVGAYGL